MMRFKKFSPMQNNSYKVLGIDPGYERIGVAIVEKNKNGKEELLYSNCIVTKRTDTHPERLRVLGEAVTSLIEEYRPNACAIEKLFFNENQKTALSVAEARGVLMFAAASKGVEVFEYTPLEVKTAITGYGRADKKQMTAMVGKLISIAKKIRYDDEYDAISIALTCFAREKVVLMSRYPQKRPLPLAKSLRFDTNRKSKKDPTRVDGLKD